MNTKNFFGCGARNLLCAFAAMLVLAFAACGDGTESGVGTNAEEGEESKEGYSDGVSLEEYSRSLTVGGELILVADQRVTWTSSNPDVALLYAEYLTGVTMPIKGISAGEAVITATSFEDPSKTAACKVTVTGGSGLQLSALEMVLVPGGSFQMGDSELIYASPVHTVTLSAFYMGKCEVTQGLYESVMGENPSFYKASNLPVGRVRWHEAAEFCNKLSAREGLQPVYTIITMPSIVPQLESVNVTADWSKNGYRLPTEAEWEYAARGGNGSPGDYIYAGSNTLREVAWDGRPASVPGAKSPNGLGLYDMSGNVSEWCWDEFYSYSGEAQTDPKGRTPESSTSGAQHVFRGGSWESYGNSFRCAARNDMRMTMSAGDLGFRLARSAQ